MARSASTSDLIGSVTATRGAGSVVVDQLTKHYSGHLAVNGVSFEVSSGQFATLLGPSGCGKTTTLRCIAGLERVDSGTIAIGDQVVSAPRSFVPPRKRGIAMVFQSLALWPHMTIADNVGYPLRMKGVAKSDARSRIERALDLVGLRGHTDRYPSQLSGGQQQRVALARALVAEPAVILYDEPLSSLDAKLREQMREELRNLHERLNMTAVYVTHDQQEAMELSDRLYVMSAGDIVQGGAPEEVYDHPANLFVGRFFGALNEFDVASIDGPVATLTSGDILRIVDAGAGAKVAKVVIRPHRVELLADPGHGATQPNVMTAAVVRAAVYGDRSRYTLTTQRGTRLVVDSIPHGASPKVGDEVTVRLAPENCLPMAG